MSIDYSHRSKAHPQEFWPSVSAFEQVYRVYGQKRFDNEQKHRREKQDDTSTTNTSDGACLHFWPSSDIHGDPRRYGDAGPAPAVSHTNGPASLWTVTQAATCSPAGSMARLIWARTDGLGAIWTLDYDDNLISVKNHGSDPGWSGRAASTSGLCRGSGSWNVV